ncbi:MAG: hypothetical protein IJZ70_08785 [Bacteroidales bacterium]|nr:hypothetical protein [Bacteroidales bacterium]
MKRIVLWSFAIVAMALTGCVKDTIESTGTDVKYREVTVNACMDPFTKTEISAVAGGYSVSWVEGDVINLYECAPAAEEYYWNSVAEFASDPLEEGDIVDGKAGFSFQIEERTGENVEYTYVATHGSAYAMYEEWESSSDSFYQRWAKIIGYEGEYIAPHMLLNISFPSYQSPSADSFDPYADVLISKIAETDEQLSGETFFSFARLGTILKITLTGLEDYAGLTVNRANFLCGESCRIIGNLMYDPVLMKYGFENDGEEVPMSDEMYGSNSIVIYPMDESVVVRPDGTADLWIRTLSGEVTDWFELSVDIGDEGLSLVRYVDLDKIGKSIVLPEGGMSVFSVGNWLIADVEGVWDIQCEVNDAMDGFTAIWEGDKNAVGYLCELRSSGGDVTELKAVSDGNGLWSVSVEGGLAPDYYSLYLKPVPAEGHGLVVNEFSYHMLAVGMPDEWHFAHDAFSDGEYVEGTEDEYIIDFSPGKVRYKNLSPVYDSAWQALKSSGEWFMYSTEPFKKMHAIEIWSKDDSYLNVNVYASKTPNEQSLKLEGVIIEESEINAGSGSYKYHHIHKLVRYEFPEDEVYQYYTLNGSTSGILMTSQYSYVYYFK